MILLDNKIESVPKFISAQKLLEDKFILEFSYNDKNKKNPRRTIQLNLGDIACFVKPHSGFVCDTIVRGILPKRPDIICAIKAAQASVGPNSFVKEAELEEAHGFLVYKIKVVDENMKKYKVIVDPGNGQVLLKKEITWYDEHDKMGYGDEKKYDEYGGSSHEGYDDKNKMMMMKDKEY